MSIFGKLFGKSSTDKVPTTQEAIQKLLELEDIMVKRQAVIERKIEEELAIAKQNGTINKRLALQALKRKKRFETQLNQIDGTLTTLEYQREALEKANTNTEVMKVMKMVAEVTKSAYGEIDIDKVHDLKDDIQEQNEIAKEISDVISSPIGIYLGIDEDDLLKELEELEQENLDSELLELPSTDPLPEVPSKNLPAPAIVSSIKKKNIAEEKELDELLSWAS